MKKVVEDNNGKLPDDARAKITEAMQNVSFNGVTGKVAFDEYGDATNKQLTVYSVEDGTLEAGEVRHLHRLTHTHTTQEPRGAPAHQAPRADSHPVTPLDYPNVSEDMR